MIYFYSLNDGISGVVNGIVFVEHEWEITSHLADYYRSTEEQLLKKGLTYRKINNLEQLSDYSKDRNVIAFM